MEEYRNIARLTPVISPIISARTLIVTVLLLSFAVSAFTGSVRHPFNFEHTHDGPIPFDIYFNDESEKVKHKSLSLLVKTMINKPDQVAYIISYGNIGSLNCEAIDNLKAASAFIQKEKKIPTNRVVYVNGGYRKRGMTEIYLVPVGASFSIPKFDINDILNASQSR